MCWICQSFILSKPKDRIMEDDKKHSKTLINVALIGLIGSIGAALIANWDKISPSHTPSPVPVHDGSKSQEPETSTFTFTVVPTTGRGGQEVTLYLSEPELRVMVYFNGKPLPKKSLNEGKTLIVTIPGGTKLGSSYFELVKDGKSLGTRQEFIVLQ